MKSLYRKRFFHLASSWHFAHLSEKAAHSARGHSRCVMLFDPKHEEHVGRLEDGLRHANALAPDLMSDVIAQACTRFAAHGATAKAKVNRLIECGAWVDATLALVQIELPQWKLRRVIYEDGEWLCSLSKQPRLPLGLDEVSEVSHEDLALAILIAFLQARRAGAASLTAVQVPPAPGYAACCDNFA